MPCLLTPITSAPWLPGASTPLVRGSARSWSRIGPISIAPAGGSALSSRSAGAVTGGLELPSIRGQITPGNPFSAAIVSPNAAATAVTLARKIVRGRRGSGASTRTSRRLGNVESHDNTANNPTTSMLVAITKCSNASGRNTCPTCDFPPNAIAGAESMMLKKISSAANCPTSLFESPSACAESSSRSTMRNRNSRYNTRNCSLVMCGS